MSATGGLSRGRLGVATTAVCVLGMHRSGTSCVAGTLQAAGLHLGDVSTAEKHNQKGNREHGAINALHDDLLADNGGSWRDPPDVVRWSRDHRIRRDAIIAEMTAAAPRWGFKDPCTLFTLDGWLEVLPTAAFVGIVRHPRAVIRSLEARRGATFRGALALWTTYNRRLVTLRDRHDIPMICFDLPAPDLIAVLKAACARLDLDPAGADAFFEATLRHHDGREESWDGLPAEARSLYEQLAGHSS